MRIGSTHTASVIIVICAAVGIAGYVAYRTFNPASPPQERQMPVIGKFTAVSPPLPAPGVAYLGRDGKDRRLADLRGRWLLVNLWATWCAPCIKEMPSLGRLQTELGTALTVVAISEDRSGAKAVEPFLAAHAIGSPAIGLDPSGGMVGALHVEGLPTSLLIDPQGRIVAKLEGAAEWDSGPTLAALKGLMAAGAKPTPTP
jgi:thiol-disulfide isomerase/thioredoxin